MSNSTTVGKTKVIKQLEDDIKNYLERGGKVNKIKAGEHKSDLPTVIRRRVTVK